MALSLKRGKTQDAQAADLQHILTNLHATVSDFDQQLAAKHQQLAEKSDEERAIVANKNRYQGALVACQQRRDLAALAVSRATTDSRLAKGSALAQEKDEALQVATEALLTVERELTTLQQSWSADEQARLDTQGEIAQVEREISALQAERADVAGSLYRWEQDYRSHLKEQTAQDLQAIDARIASLLGQVDQERAARSTRVDQYAHDLSPWAGDAQVQRMLAEVIHVDGDVPAVIAAQQEMAKAEAELAQAKRQRAMSGDVALDSTIASAHLQVVYLTGRIEALRTEQRTNAAVELLRQVRQPMVETTIQHVPSRVAEAAPAPVPVPAPTRETITPRSGIKAFAVAGAVPTPPNSLLNPHVRQKGE